MTFIPTAKRCFNFSSLKLGKYSALHTRGRYFRVYQSKLSKSLLSQSSCFPSLDKIFKQLISFLKNDTLFQTNCSDLYTLSQSKLLENHTLHSGTYLYSPYMAVPPPPGASHGQDVSQVLSQLTRLELHHVGVTDELMLFSKDVNCLLLFIELQL